MKFDVFLPSLLVSPDWFADSAPPRLKAIETLLARGRLHTTDEWPTPLLKEFDAGNAVAAFTALGDSIDTGAEGWMFADPTHFQAGRGTVKLISAAHLNVSASETAQLIDALNMNFADRGLLFFCGASGAWYVCCKVDELPKTTAPGAAMRGIVSEALPESSGKLSWKAIQNEAQMLFHSHPVNADREAAGKLTINGVWFWGEGVLPKPRGSTRKGSRGVFGNTAFAKGLAIWSGASFASLAELDFAGATLLAEDHVVLIDSLSIHHQRHDAGKWREAAMRLDLQIFSPLLALLRLGAINEIALTLPRDRDTLVVNVNAHSFCGIAGWWKNMTQNPRPVQDYFIA